MNYLKKLVDSFRILNIPFNVNNLPKFKSNYQQKSVIYTDLYDEET